MEYAVMAEQDVPAIAKVYMEYITFTRTAAGSTKKRTNGSIREIVIFAAYQNKGYGTALLQEIERRDTPAKGADRGAEPKAATAGKLSYEQKKEQEKLLRRLRKAVDAVETQLAGGERQIAEYDARFAAAATTYNEADYKAYNDLKAQYDHLMHEWEKASYELEITEEQYNG